MAGCSGTYFYRWLALSAFLVTCSVGRYRKWGAQLSPFRQELLLACPSKTCPVAEGDSIELSHLS